MLYYKVIIADKSDLEKHEQINKKNRTIDHYKYTIHKPTPENVKCRTLAVDGTTAIERGRGGEEQSFENCCLSKAVNADEKSVEV